MNKNEFLLLLKNRLAGLPEEDVKRTLDYYSEIIDDRVEEGLSEYEAILALGSLDDIVAQIYAEASASHNNPQPPKAETNKGEKKHIDPWMIAVLVLTSPIWLTALGSLLGGIITVVVSFYAAVVALIASGAGCIIGAFLFETWAEAVLAAGVGMVCIGIAILWLFATNWIMKHSIRLCRKAFVWCRDKIKGRGNRVENL